MVARGRPAEVRQVDVGRARRHRPHQVGHHGLRPDDPRAEQLPGCFHQPRVVQQCLGLREEGLAGHHPVGAEPGVGVLAGVLVPQVDDALEPVRRTGPNAVHHQRRIVEERVDSDRCGESTHCSSLRVASVPGGPSPLRGAVSRAAPKRRASPPRSGP